MIRIREAVAGDEGTILGFIRELAEYELAPQEVIATEADIRSSLFGQGQGALAGRGPAAECLIGEIDGKPLGIALFFHNYSTWKGRRGLYLEDLYVTPAARGKGLGKALFCRVGAIAVERGCARYEWSVLDWNTPALDFYRAMGATPMSEWTVQRLDGDALRRVAAMDVRA